MNQPSASSLRHERAWLALVLFAILLLGLPTLLYPPSGDQGDFATGAQQLLRGGAMYTQVWNPKPPLTHFLYALAISIGGPQMLAVRLLDLLCTLVTAWLIYRLGRELYDPPTGLVAAFAYASSYLGYGFDNLAEPEGFMVLPMVASIYCLRRAEGGNLPRWVYASGVMLGLACEFKYTAVGLAVVLLLVIWGWRQGGELGRNLALLTAGFLTLLAALLLYLLANGAMGEFLHSIAVTSVYTSFGFGGSFAQAVERLVSGVLIFHIGLWALAIVALVHDFSQRRNLSAAQADTSRWLWVWLLITLLAMLVQLKLYPYHWIPMLAPLALLAGRGFTLAWGGISHLSNLRPMLRNLTLAALLLALVARPLKDVTSDYPPFIAYLSGQISTRDYLSNFGGLGLGAGQGSVAKQQVADYIAAHTRPDQQMFAWGFIPDLYFLSQRQPLGRFYYSYVLIAPGYPPAWRDEFIAAMHATPPAYFVVTNHDYAPFLTGYEDDSAGQLQYFPALQAMLAHDYIAEQQIGDFSIYHHR